MKRTNDTTHALTLRTSCADGKVNAISRNSTQYRLMSIDLSLPSHMEQVCVFFFILERECCVLVTLDAQIGIAIEENGVLINNIVGLHVENDLSKACVHYSRKESDNIRNKSVFCLAIICQTA